MDQSLIAGVFGLLMGGLAGILTSQMYYDKRPPISQEEILLKIATALEKIAAAVEEDRG